MARHEAEQRSMARYLGFSLLLFLSLVVGRPAGAREVMIRDIVVTNSSTDLLLFLKLVDAFSPEIIIGVKNGLAATFNFEITVDLVREGWPNKEITRTRVDHTLRYDTLKREFRLALSENGPEEATIDSEERAMARMAELNGIKLLALHALEPDRQYVLKVRAILAKQDLPPYVRYLIPFGNFWNVHSEWYAVRFRY